MISTVASPPQPRGARQSAVRAGSAFQEAAVREVTRLHEARESPWWVEDVGVPVPVAGGFEAVDVVLHSPRAVMALQCLRVTPLPTFRFERRPGRTTVGNLFTTAREVRHSGRGAPDVRECPALYAAAMRALRGACGLDHLKARPGDAARSPGAIPAVLTMARLVPDLGPPAMATRSRVSGEQDAATDRFWVWLLAGTADPRPRGERRPVAIVTWTGLHHFLGVAAPEPQASALRL